MASKPAAYTANPSWNKAQKDRFELIQKAIPIALSYMGSEIPVLDNHTDAMLVDEVGLLKQALKPFKDSEAAHVERLKARMGAAQEMRGDEYYAQYTGGARTILNQQACKDIIAKFEEEGIHIGRLLAAILSKQITVPNNVFLQESDKPEVPDESNDDDFYVKSGGAALYVKPY